MNLCQVRIYRIFHIENIPHIIANGITHKDSPKANPNFVTIGDKSLISNRNTNQVGIDNGNTSNTIEKITLGDFIPFYFGVKMPMLYVVQLGGNFVKKATKPEDIVYVVCSVHSLVGTDLVYYFSDGHATDSLTTLYNKDKISELPQIVDWNAVIVPYWGGGNLDIKRKKQAEFLVKGDIPANFIIEYRCYSESAKQKLIGSGINTQLVKVTPEAYF